VVAPAAIAGLLVVAGSLVSVFVYTAPHPASAAAGAPGSTRPTPAPSGHRASPHPGARRAEPRPAGHVTTKPRPAHPTKPTKAPAKPRPVKPAAPPAVSAFGDSVMLGATADLSAAIAHLTVSAVEGRQARDVFADIAKRRAAGSLGSVVVIHTGDNGIISPDDLSSTLDSLGKCRRVVVLTDRVPRDWQGPNNEILHNIVGQFRNAVLVDWYAIANSHRDWFYKDGLHLRPPGAQAYVAAITNALR
jgi:hypothetical protein